MVHRKVYSITLVLIWGEGGYNMKIGIISLVEHHHSRCYFLLYELERLDLILLEFVENLSQYWGKYC